MTIITLEMSDLNSFILSVLITEYGNGCGPAIAKPQNFKLLILFKLKKLLGIILPPNLQKFIF